MLGNCAPKASALMTGKINDFSNDTLVNIQEFRGTFEVNKANGIEWPGIFEDREGISPVIYNIVDEEILIRELKHAGFKMLKSTYIQKPVFGQERQYSDPDWLIAIAEKE